MQRYKSYLIFIFFLFISVLLTILDISGQIYSIRAIFYYILLPPRIATQLLTVYPFKISDRISTLLSLHTEYEEMKMENMKLKIIKERYDTVVNELNRLKMALNFKVKRPYKVIPAEIVSKRSPYETVTINCGRKSGIKKNSPVISFTQTEPFIFGRVTEVYENESVVTLVTNQLSFIPAKLENSNTDGVITGSGKDYVLFEYLSTLKDIKIGDRVVVSEVSEIFPEGMLMGIITDISKDRVVVRPVRNLMGVNEVLCLLAE